jgi:hypothetical protein
MRVCPLFFVSFAILAITEAHPARADGVLPPAATPVQREQAQGRFLRGKDLLTKKRYDEALAEFRASHDIVASPNTRLETARCLVGMGNLVAAYAEFGRTAVEAKELASEDNRYKRAYDAAMAERAEIEPKVGFVTMTIENPSDTTQLLVGGEEIRRAAWSEPAPVQSGETEIVVSTPGRDPIKRKVTVGAGEKTALVIDAQSGDRPVAEAPPQPPPATIMAPPPPAHAKPWMRTGAYVAGGVGVVGLATFAIFGLMAKSTYDDLNTACGGGPCPPDKADEISSGKTKQTVANVGLAFGIVGAAAGATLFVLSASKANAAPSAALTISPGWIGVRGRL